MMPLVRIAPLVSPLLEQVSGTINQVNEIGGSTNAYTI
jgi:hypothetical protein